MFYNRYHWNQVLAQNQIHAAQLPAAQLIPGMGGMAGMAGVPGMAGHLVSIKDCHLCTRGTLSSSDFSLATFAACLYVSDPFKASVTNI